MQQADNICFLQIIRLKDVELWQTKDGNLSLKGKGNLQALYTKDMALYVLKFNDQKWHLSKNFQIVGSFCGNEGYYSYNIPSFDGFYTFKILESEAGPALTNFETFLSNTCQFIRKDNLHQELHRPQEGKFKETLHKTLDTISHVFHHHEKETEANQRIVRPFQDMLTVEGHQEKIVDIPSFEILNLLQEAGEIIRNHQDTEAWVALRGEFQPTLIEAGDKLFVDKHDIGLQKWGSNVTNASTSTIHSGVSFDNLSLGSDRGLSGGSLEGGRPNLGQNTNLTSNVLNANIRPNPTNITNQPLNQASSINTDLA